MSDPKFTADVRARLTAGFQVGLPVSQLADFAGITRYRLDKWLNLAADSEVRIERDEEVTEFERELAEFFISGRQSYANLAAGALGALQKEASKGDTSSAKWILERLYPEDFGKDTTTNITVTVGDEFSSAATPRHMTLAAAMSEAIEKHRGHDEQRALETGDIVEGEIVEDE